MIISRSATCALLLCTFVGACSSDNSPAGGDGGMGGSDSGAGGKASTGGSAGKAGSAGTGGSAGYGGGGAAGKGTGGSGTGGQSAESDASVPDGSTPDGAAGASPDAGDGGGIPTAPKLGAQIDRMGRPAINTALNHTFDTDTTSKNAAKDAYNDALPATWSRFESEFEKNLAILDSLDTNCGNQLLADTTKTGPDRYKTLADVLTDDQLYVDATQSTCGVYLGVEAEFVGAVGSGAGKCGGRTPKDDVIERSYSVLAAGALSGVDDGITADDGAQTATFPFLGPPSP